jgi:hypothetical protein
MTTETNALVTIVQSMGVTRSDQIIPVRGEPSVDPSTGETHIRFMRPGVEGEFHLRYRLEHTPPFKGAGT